MFALAACGGGDGSPAPVAGPKPEEVYGGTLTGSTSSAFQMLVLENDEIWAMYGIEASGVFYVAGFLQGQAVSTGNSLSSSDVRDFGSSPPLVGSATATFNSAARSIQGTVVTPSGAVAFNDGPIPGSPYDYDTPASLSAIAGSWALADYTGEGISQNVAASGAYTARTASGCAISGTMAPRASGKNVFNVALTFGPAPCLLAGQSASGIAVAYPLAAGRTQLIVAAHDAGRNQGTVAFGSR